MKASFRLLGERRFLPLFVTQFLGAFNDNLFKTALVLLVTYELYSDPGVELRFNSIATGLSILPFVLLSALAGQLADSHDKARIIRIVKTAEIGIMVIGGAGMLMKSAPVMLVALLAMGVHSTFFGPIKYAILPQHLDKDEVLGGTGLVEAGTYLSILAGTIVAGFLSGREAAALALVVALIGWFSGRCVPAAPPSPAARDMRLDLNPFRASIRLVSSTMHIRRLFLAICAISFFWTIGAMLIVEFPPLVKNVFTASKEVASLFLGIFSIGVALGSILINRLLCGQVSARYAPASVLGMAGFVVLLFVAASRWQGLDGGALYGMRDFASHPQASLVFVSLFGVAVTGGMFVVPLYAFLTTTVPQEETARTVAANNIVNCGGMVCGSLAVTGLAFLGVTVLQSLLLVAALCLVSAWIALRLHRACD